MVNYGKCQRISQQWRNKQVFSLFWKTGNDEADVITQTHTHNRFTALLSFVRDYLGEPAPQR